MQTSGLDSSLIFIALEQLILQPLPAGLDHAQMAEGVAGQHTSAWGARQQSLLNQVGFDDLLDGIARFRQCRRDGLDADRSAAVVLRDKLEVFAVHGVQTGLVHLKTGQSLIRDGAGNRVRATIDREIAHPAQQSARDAGGAAGAASDLVCSIGGHADAEHACTPSDNQLKFIDRIELQTDRNAEAVTQGGGQKPCAGRGTDEREPGEVDLHRTRCRTLTDDQIQLKVLHGGIEDFLHRRVEPMDLVDEQHIAFFEIGQLRCKVAGLRDHRAGCRAEVDPEFLCHDLRQRRLAEAGRTDEEHVIERLAACTGRGNEHFKIGACLGLAREVRQALRAQMGLDIIVLRRGGEDAAGFGHGRLGSGTGTDTDLYGTSSSSAHTHRATSSRACRQDVMIHGTCRAVMTETSAPALGQNRPPSFSEALSVWIRVGLLSFGGAAGQIAMLHTIIVDEKKWLDEKRFLHALNYCTLLPGPEAQQLATYIGWLLHGVRGGLAAGLLFVIPGALVVLGLTILYVLAAGIPVIEGLFFGIKAAVLVIVVQAVLKMSKRVGRTPLLVSVMAGSFLAIFFFEVPYPFIVIAAALIGAFGAVAGGDAPPAPSPQAGRLAKSLTAVMVWGVIWWAPVAIAAMLLGPAHILTEIGLFFSKLAVVTFGGAYALLVWLAQAAVEDKGWLTAIEMADGLGLAETTPGPTILVTQFVGFLAGYRAPAPFSPLLAGVLAALMTTWVTFAPSFLWIFAGAPYVEDLRANRRLAAALQGITAAVIGVILYLAVWFALHVLFGRVSETHVGPLRWFIIDLSAFDVRAAVLATVAFVLAFVMKLDMLKLVATMAGLGVAARLLT